VQYRGTYFMLTIEHLKTNLKFYTACISEQEHTLLVNFTRIGAFLEYFWHTSITATNCKDAKIYQLEGKVYISLLAGLNTNKKNYTSLCLV